MRITVRCENCGFKQISYSKAHAQHIVRFHQQQTCHYDITLDPTPIWVNDVREEG